MSGMEVAPGIDIPEGELHFTFARSGGPGGQNVNKVASKAVLHWELSANTSLPAAVAERLRARQRRRITNEGQLVVSSERFRDQAKNIADCRDKVRAMVREVLHPPRPRKATRPSRASKQRRLAAKKRRGETKALRRKPAHD
jgi:ribosome-associated protein